MSLLCHLSSKSINTTILNQIKPLWRLLSVFKVQHSCWIFGFERHHLLWSVGKMNPCRQGYTVFGALHPYMQFSVITFDTNKKVCLCHIKLVLNYSSQECINLPSLSAWNASHTYLDLFQSWLFQRWITFQKLHMFWLYTHRPPYA